jgi:hypothetical protein
MRWSTNVSSIGAKTSSWQTIHKVELREAGTGHRPISLIGGGGRRTRRKRRRGEFVHSMTRRYHSEDLGIVGTITFKWIFKKQGVIAIIGGLL